MATELASLYLRRARSRSHFRLKQAEDLAQSYRDKLAWCPASAPSRQSWNCRCVSGDPNPVFARTELTRLALAILRDAEICIARQGRLADA
jgi:hypothetical protein